MFQNNVSFVKTEWGWLLSSNVVTNLETGNNSIRSYLGAFFMGNKLQRTKAQWESEKPATLDEIALHAPQPYISQEEYERKQDELHARWIKQRTEERQAVRKGSKILFTTILVVTVIISAIVMIS